MTDVEGHLNLKLDTIASAIHDIRVNMAAWFAGTDKGAPEYTAVHVAVSDARVAITLLGELRDQLIRDERCVYDRATAASNELAVSGPAEPQESVRRAG